MSDEQEPIRFREVHPATAKAAYRSAFENLKLTPQELLLGKVDEEGDILWSGCPRWLLEHPGPLPTVDGIIDEIFGAEGSTAADRDRGE
jgi:hypothetical protein